MLSPFAALKAGSAKHLPFPCAAATTPQGEVSMQVSRAQLLSQLGFRWAAMPQPRFDRLTDDEYYWEPASGCWSMRRSAVGRLLVEGQWFS